MLRILFHVPTRLRLWWCRCLSRPGRVFISASTAVTDGPVIESISKVSGRSSSPPNWPRYLRLRTAYERYQKSSRRRTELDDDERTRLEKALEIGLEDTFPASDAVAAVQPAPT